MTTAYICDGIRTPIGRYGGALSKVRADDLAAIPLKALAARNPGLDLSAAILSRFRASPSTASAPRAWRPSAMPRAPSLRGTTTSSSPAGSRA